MPQNHVEGLLKTQMLGPRVSESVGLGGDPRVGISNQVMLRFPGDAEVAGWGTTL